MTKTTRLLVAAMMLVAGARVEAQTAQAAQPSPLKVAVQNTTATAEASRGAARKDTTVHAGDVLRYTLTFDNVTGRAVRGVKLENPIVAGMQMVAGSAKASRTDAVLEFSADNGKSWAAQPMETVTVDGKQVRRPVSADRYSHVRWMVAGPVAMNATVTASFDARLTPASSAALPSGGR